MKLFVLGIYIVGYVGYVAGSTGLAKFQLEEFCKEAGSYDISMIAYDVYAGEVQFTFKDSMPHDFICTVVVGANGFEDRDRLSFYFTRFDLGDNCGPSETWLSVMDGDGTIEPRPIPGLPTRLCGRTFDFESKTFETSWRHLYIKYHANNPEVGSGFAIVFKHLADPPCMPYEFRCDTDRCIPDDLKCNGEDLCGDNSDCKKGIDMGMDAIIGIVVGVCVGIGVLVACYKYVPKSKCVKSDSRQQQQTRPPFTTTLSPLPPTERSPMQPRPPMMAEVQPEPPMSAQDDETDFIDQNSGEPPSYASLQDTSHSVSDVRPHMMGTTCHDSHARGQNNGASTHRSVTPPAPVDTNPNTEQNEQYEPPPPPYDMVINFRDVYNVTESEPSTV